MTNLDMAEAVRLLAADRGIPVDTLLQVLADALVAAYKRRPDAADEAEVEIDADTMDIRVIAYDIDEDGNFVNPRDDKPIGLPLKDARDDRSYRVGDVRVVEP